MIPKHRRLHALIGAALLLVLASSAAVYWARHARVSAPKFEDSNCRAEYLARYPMAPDGGIDVRVVFGYKDARPARFVGDIYERNALAARILAPCAPRRGACGFGRSDDDMDLFTRRIGWPTSSTQWASAEVRLRVVASPAGPDDEENRADPFQKWRTDYARETFEDGLGSSRAVFYDGHSRDGGGPDFGPPRLNSWGHVDYEWYQAHKPGLNTMIPAIRGCELLGLFSCASDRLFTRRLHMAKPGLRLLLLRRLVYYTEALEDAYSALSDLLEMKCRPPESEDSGAGKSKHALKPAKSRA